jgi:hypothetical protein
VVRRDDVVLRARFGCFDGDLGKRGNTVLHPDGDIINGSATQCTMANVARPPRVVFFCEATRARWSPTSDVARPSLVVLSRWQLRVSLREVRIWWFHSVRWCVMLQQQVPHGGGLLGAVQSVSFVSLSPGPCLDDDCIGRRRLLAAAARLRSASIVMWRGSTVLTSQSNRLGLSR